MKARSTRRPGRRRTRSDAPVERSANSSRTWERRSRNSGRIFAVGTIALPSQDRDLHGSVPECSRVALLLIDVINDLDFVGSELLVRQALPMAHRLAKLEQRAWCAGIPAIYINDNFGKWRSDFRKLVEH